ncbi:MAG: hypothetical protein ACRC0G_17800 [Fusobacteriaceae bacterium]
MAHDSLWVAYAKAHYPIQTYKACIDLFTRKKDKDKVAKLKTEAQRFFDIKVPTPRFGQDNRKISYDIESKTIYMDLSTVKHVNSNTAEGVFKAKDDMISYSELYSKRAFYGIDKRGLTSLIKIGYFENFGNPLELLAINSLFKEYKVLNKNNLGKEYLKYAPYVNLTVDEFEDLCYIISDGETPNQLKYSDPLKLFKEISRHFSLEEPSSLLKLYWEVDLTGSHEQDLNNGSLIGSVVSKSIDKFSKKNKLCVLDVKTNREVWVTIDAFIPCEEKNLVYLPNVEIKVSKSGFVNRITKSVSNLTRMFGGKKED